MADPKLYAYWRAELAAPGSMPRDTDDHVAGYYRGIGAKTKIDWPIAVWYDEGTGTPHVQVGNSQQEGHAAELEFRSESTWAKCQAVTHDAYQAAMASGFWSDGKPARNMSEAEKLDIIPTTPADEGGNMVDDEGNPIDPFWLQIKTKLENAQAAIEKLGKIDTEDKATKLAEQIEVLRGAGKLGEAQRVKEKTPHDTAANEVQAKWVPVLRPASDAIKLGVDAIDKFKKAERARLQAIADEAARVERERVAEVNRQIAADNAAAEAEAAAKGEEAAPAAELLPEPEAVKVDAPRVSSAYGRAVTKAIVRKGKITDEAKFIKAIKGGADFKEFLQTKANALARAKTKVAGMEIEEI